MSHPPLPFRLKAPGADSVGLAGIKSVSFRIDGVLRHTEHGLMFEWTGTRTTEQVSFVRIGTDVEELSLEWLELPFERVAGIWLVGGWWRPQLEVRALEIDDFDGVPGARGVTLRLRLHRRDRKLARSLVTDIRQHVTRRLIMDQSERQIGVSDDTTNGS